MRWLICCLAFPLSASAASVLLVPVDEKARALADELVEPFGAVKLTVKMAGPGSPAVNCLKAEARDGCLDNIAEKAKVEAVFIVTGAMKGAKGTLTLEMLVDGKVIKIETTRVNKGKVKAQMRAPISALLKLIPKSEPVETPKVPVTENPKQPEPVVVEPPRRDPEPPKVVVDAPRKTEPVVLTPNKRMDLQITVPPLPRQKKSKAGAVIVTVLAVAAAGTAATFAGLGFAGKGRLETITDNQSNLSYADAVALRDTSNLELTVALGSGIGAGVAGVVAVILWGAE